MRAKIDQTGNFRACASLPVDFIWATEPFFFFSLHFGGERGWAEEKEEIFFFFPVFGTQMELQNEKLKKPFPASAESTGPTYLTFWCSSYFMSELHFEILHSAGCLKQQSQKTHLHLCPAPRLQKWAHGGSTGSSHQSVPSKHHLIQWPSYLVSGKWRVGLATWTQLVTSAPPKHGAEQRRMLAFKFEMCSS